MKVSYERPVRNAQGVYVFPNPIMRFYSSYFSHDHFVRLDSKGDVHRLQERVLDTVDHLVTFLEGYELPQGIDGGTSVRFRICDVRHRRLLLPGKIGEVGLPNFYIQTSLGHSEMYMWPHRFGMLNPSIGRDGVSLNVSGNGLAQKLAEETIPMLELSFHQQPQTYNPRGKLKRVFVTI